jgi:EAL domain-containing protein (putative c-di-GMP-specific phosphodiesterase class I)
MKTVAEGVETLPHVKELENMGCDLLQGYFYSKPIPKNDFVEFLQNFSQEEK